MSSLLCSDKKRISLTLLAGIALLCSFTGTGQQTLAFDPAWIAVLLCGIPILLDAAKGLFFDHNIKADVLVAMALLSSLFIREYFAAGEVAFIMQIGSILEDATAEKAKEELKKLIRLTANEAHIKRNNRTESIPIEDIRPGDVLVVLAGETIPVDGTILYGQSAINESIMTGESLPVDKVAGDNVISGTLNQFGTFEMTAQKLPQDSALQKMIQLAKEAEEKKAPIISLADQWATWMVIASFITAIITGLITQELIRAVTVLVVFCPCAFILATPTAVMAGIANATKHGLLIKSGEALERCAKITGVAFDKTGTLTKGTLQIIALDSCLPQYSSEQILELAATVEARSEHPIGKAVCAAFSGSLSTHSISAFNVTTGNGLEGMLDGQPFLLGKADFLQQQGIALSPEQLHKAAACQNQGATVIYLSLAKQLAGMIALADCLRPTAPAAISHLKDLRIESILLTGDHPRTAEYIAALADIKTIHAGLLPKDKMQIIQDYMQQGKKLCMVGDGINDSLALRTAYAGIAMGGIGSDIAVESSDVVLINDDIGKLPYLFFIAQKTMKKIRFNIIFSMLLNFLAVALAVSGLLTPITGALVHNCGSVFVVLNSAFLLNEHIPAAST